MFSKVVLLCCLFSVDAAPHTYDQSQTGELNVQVDLKDLQIFALLNGQREEFYEDIDYAYDYAEMTIKPQTGTSKKPLNVTTTTTDNVTIATTVNVLGDTTEAPKNSTQAIETTPLVNDAPTTVKSETAIPLNNETLESNTTIMLQSRKDDGTTLPGKNDTETTQYMESITKTANESDPVTRKPQALMSNISSIKSEVESTTKNVNTIGSNVTTKQVRNCKKGFVLNQRGGCDLKIQSMSNALLKIVKLSQKLKSRRHRRNGQDTL